MFTAVVDLPTPPFWLATAITRRVPFSDSRWIRNETRAFLAAVSLSMLGCVSGSSIEDSLSVNSVSRETSTQLLLRPSTPPHVPQEPPRPPRPLRCAPDPSLHHHLQMFHVKHPRRVSPRVDPASPPLVRQLSAQRSLCSLAPGFRCQRHCCGAVLQRLPPTGESGLVGHHPRAPMKPPQP
jgi:hypothetical protein